jgi:hypothetical protein
MHKIYIAITKMNRKKEMRANKTKIKQIKKYIMNRVILSLIMIYLYF